MRSKPQSRHGGNICTTKVKTRTKLNKHYVVQTCIIITRDYLGCRELLPLKADTLEKLGTDLATEIFTPLTSQKDG